MVGYSRQDSYGLRPTCVLVRLASVEANFKKTGQILLCRVAHGSESQSALGPGPLSCQHLRVGIWPEQGLELKLQWVVWRGHISL